MTAPKAGGSSRTEARTTCVEAAEAPLRRAYYVYGPAEGEALWRHLRARIEARLREMAGDGLTLVRLEGPDAWQGAGTEARTLAFGGQRLIVAVPEGAPGEGVAGALGRAMDAPAPGVTLLLREPVGDGRRRGQDVGALRASPHGVEAPALDRRASAAFVAQAGEALGLRWGPGAPAFLYQQVGEDLLLALGELDKYRDVLAPDAALDRTTIERLTPGASAARVYPVGDAYLAGDLAAALAAAHAAMEAGEGAFGIAGYLARQVRLLAGARAYAAERRGAGERVDAEGMASALGLRPWQARPLAAAAARPRPRSDGGFVALVEADLDLKSGMPPALAIDRLLIRLIDG